MSKKQEIDELEKKREKHLISSKENDDNSHKLIVEMYADFGHYIYELLQNTDDAKATEIIFRLSNKCLEVEHNGTKLFDYKDVKSITTIGLSTKKDDINTIGKFGAGFKSVFNITHTPEIYSGGYRFKITDYIVPHWLDNKVELNKYKTLIRLPFKNLEKDKSIILKQLESITKECLLFLKNIKIICWYEDESKKNILTRQQVEKEYLQFENTITISGKKLDISIAFSQGKNKEIIAINNAKLFVFFPVEKETTGLKFLVHAPYKTELSRETIPFDDEENKQISEKLAQLVASSLEKIKKQGLLTVDFLSILPIDNRNDNLLYKTMFEKVKEALINKPLLPTNNKGFTSANQALLAREKKLTDLLTQKDCLTLFDKKYWLSTSITSNKTRDLHDYLKEELEIEEVSMDDFCRKINEKFIKQKQDIWLTKFYKSVINVPSLYRKQPYNQEGILREKPIIRLNKNNKLVCPDDYEQVYFPTGRKTNFKTIKKCFANNKQSREFLEKLGVIKPDGIAEIKEFIVKEYKTENPNITRKKYLEDFKIVLDIYQSANTDGKKEGIISLLKNCYFIYCQNPQEYKSYQKPVDIYFKNDITKMWFKNNTDENIYFLDKSIDIKDSVTFLEKLGVNTNVGVFKKNIVDISNRGYYKRSVNGFNPKFNIHELNFILENITIERSKLLWKILLKNYNKLSGCLEKTTNLNRSYEKEKQQKSKAGKLLLAPNCYWLYNKDSKLVEKPLSDILLNNLHDDYDKNHNNIDKLIKALGLKLDKVKAFEEETGLYAITKEKKLYYEQLEEKERIKQSNQKKWWAESEINDVKVNVDNNPINPRTNEDLSYTNQVTSNNTQIQYNKNKNDDSLNKYNSTDLINIGMWGEEYARKHLLEKHKNEEVIWCNENSKNNKGYDFVVRENGEDLFYYEVKSKTDENPYTFYISNSQWEWAKIQKNKYIILLVSNTGKKNPKIKEYINPVKLWHEGKIYASPVGIKLT